MRIVGSGISPALLDVPLFRELFAATEPKTNTGTTAWDCQTINTNLPADAVIKSAILHIMLGTGYSSGFASTLLVNGNQIAADASGIMGGSNGTEVDILHFPVDPSYIVANGANTIRWNGTPSGGSNRYAGCYLEVCYTLAGNAASILRRGRKGFIVASNPFAKLDVTNVASGDVFSWAGTFAIPAGTVLKNVALINTLTGYYYGNNPADIAINGGQLKIVPPGGAVSNVGAALSPGYWFLQKMPSVEVWKELGSHTFAYDLRALVTQPGDFTVKWNALVLNSGASHLYLTSQYALWISYALDSSG